MLIESQCIVYPSVIQAVARINGEDSPLDMESRDHNQFEFKKFDIPTKFSWKRTVKHDSTNKQSDNMKPITDDASNIFITSTEDIHNGNMKPTGQNLTEKHDKKLDITSIQNDIKLHNIKNTLTKQARESTGYDKIFTYRYFFMQ
jgi:hypothetical protein